MSTTKSDNIHPEDFPALISPLQDCLSYLRLNSDLKINYCSPFMLQKLEMSFQEIENQALAILFMINRNLNIQAEIMIQLAKAKKWSGEIYFCSASGSELCFESFFYLESTSDPAIPEIHSYHVDITARKKLELSLQESAKMATLGRMASGIAHEVSTPLMAINLTALLIRKQLLHQPINTELLQQKAELIENTGQLIGNIVRGLKVFSRESTQDPFLKASINQIVQGTAEICAERLKSLKIKLDFDFEGEVFIQCRASQITQVVLNLLNNSADAIEALENRWIKIRTQVVGGNLKIIFTDSGAGIPPEVLKKMMVPYFTTKEVGKGTGLGMSISKNIISEHGGSLEYDSSSPHTQFIIIIPIQQISAGSTT